MNQPVDAEYYYRYSQTLKATGDYGKANEMLSQFTQKNAEEIRAKNSYMYTQRNFIFQCHNNLLLNVQIAVLQLM